ncbi:restriction endonuclease subunit R, partial [Pseudomonas sp. MWU13-2625]
LNPKGKELKPQLSLPVRLVGLRLDKIEKSNDIGLTDTAEREITKLRSQIAALPPASFIIKEAAASLAILDEEKFWVSLSHQKIEFLRTEIKPLFRTVSESDFKAMRFERDLLEYSLGVLNEDKAQAETIKEGIVEQINELPLSISFVKQEEPLIRAAQTGHYWVNVNEDALDELVTKLGPLMKFREQNAGQEQIHLDLVDELHKKEWVEFGPQHEAVSTTRYREMVETLITELTENNPVLQRIKNGEGISPLEADQLAELLHEEHPHITEKLLRQVYKNRKARFIQFIRHIVGIEVLQSFPDEVSAAFGQFIRAHTTLSGRQLEFLNLLKNFIIEREKVEKKDLISAPFTVIH